MRPGIAPVEGEIVGVGYDAARWRLGMKNLIGDAVALAIGGRLLDGVEAQVHLLAHVARTGPAHQRLDLARLFRLVIEHPFLGLAGTGLHRSLRGLVDAGRHDALSLVLTSKCRGMVGAAGFEPATWSTQNSRATRLRYAPALPPSLDTRFGLGQQAAATGAGTSNSRPQFSLKTVRNRPFTAVCVACAAASL